MKILFVSDNAIYGRGGGCIENRKHYDALKAFCDKHTAELKVISLDKRLKERLEINIEKSRKQDVFSRMRGHSSYLYFLYILLSIYVKTKYTENGDSMLRNRHFLLT